MKDIKGQWQEITGPWGKSLEIGRLDYNDDYNEFYVLHNSKGLYKSTDGNYWFSINAGLPEGLSYSDYAIVRGASPAHFKIIFLATNKGVYRLIESNTAPVFERASVGLPNKDMRLIAWNRMSDNWSVMICGSAFYHDLNSNLFLSQDFGNTWSPLYDSGYPISAIASEIIPVSGGGYVLRSVVDNDYNLYYCNSADFRAWSRMDKTKFTECLGTSGTTLFRGTTLNELYKIEFSNPNVMPDWQQMSIPALLPPKMPLALSRSMNAPGLIVSILGRGFFYLNGFNEPLDWNASLNETLPKHSDGTFTNASLIAFNLLLSTICVKTSYKYDTCRFLCWSRTTS